MDANKILSSLIGNLRGMVHGYIASELRIIQAVPPSGPYLMSREELQVCYRSYTQSNNHELRDESWLSRVPLLGMTAKTHMIHTWTLISRKDSFILEKQWVLFICLQAVLPLIILYILHDSNVVAVWSKQSQKTHPTLPIGNRKCTDIHVVFGCMSYNQFETSGASFWGGSSSSSIHT